MRSGRFLSSFLSKSLSLKGRGSASQKMNREQIIMQGAEWIDWSRGSVAATLLIGSRVANIRFKAVKEEEDEEIIAWSIRIVGWCLGRGDKEIRRSVIWQERTVRFILLHLSIY